MTENRGGKAERESAPANLEREENSRFPKIHRDSCPKAERAREMGSPPGFEGPRILREKFRL